MAKISTSITIDADVKAKAQELFADLGLDLSTAINIFLRQSIRENGLPFTVHRSAPGPEAETPAETPLKLAEDYKSFTDMDEMIRDLMK